MTAETTPENALEALGYHHHEVITVGRNPAKLVDCVIKECNTLDVAREAFATLAEKCRRLEGRVAELERSQPEWLCESCNTVFTEKPGLGVFDLMCELCGKLVRPTSQTERLLRAERDAASLAASENLRVRQQQGEFIRAQQKELLKIHADAKRYRWLRDCTYEQERLIRTGCVDEAELLSGEQLDAAIDTAMATQEASNGRS